MTATPAFAKEDQKRSLISFGNEASVAIGAEGKALVRGAEVTSVSADHITAKTIWSGTSLTWTVETDGDTNYVNAGGKSAVRADIEEGDVISFSGMLNGSLSVAADIVRSWTAPATDGDRTHLSGEVTEVNSSSFVVMSGARSVTVEVNSDTDIQIGTEDSDLGDLSEGTKVRITGVYDGDTFVASSVTGVALKAQDGERPWHRVIDFWANVKAKFNR